MDEIRDKNYNISPSKYISGTADAGEVDDYVEIFEDTISDLKGLRDEIVTTKVRINSMLSTGATKIDFADALKFPNIFDLNAKQSSHMINEVMRVSELQTDASEKYSNLVDSLFRYWFVDFNFPNSEGLPYSECEGIMKDTVYGQIPMHWDAIPLGSILTPKSERVGSRTNVQEYSTTNRGVQLRSEKFSRAITSNSAKNKLANCGDLIFGMSREILNFGVMKDSVGGVSPAYHVYSIDNTKLNPEFLEIYMRICADYFLSLIKPGAREGQVLDKDEVQSKLIICPPLVLQNQYMLIRKFFSQIICANW